MVNDRIDMVDNDKRRAAFVKLCAVRGILYLLWVGTGVCALVVVLNILIDPSVELATIFLWSCAACALLGVFLMQGLKAITVLPYIRTTVEAREGKSLILMGRATVSIRAQIGSSQRVPRSLTLRQVIYSVNSVTISVWDISLNKLSLRRLWSTDISQLEGPRTARVQIDSTTLPPGVRVSIPQNPPDDRDIEFCVFTGYANWRKGANTLIAYLKDRAAPEVEEHSL